MVFQSFFIFIDFFFSMLLWLMVFMGTYMHFPKMEYRERLIYSGKMATTVAGMVFVVVLIGTYFTSGMFA